MRYRTGIEDLRRTEADVIRERKREAKKAKRLKWPKPRKHIYTVQFIDGFVSVEFHNPNEANRYGGQFGVRYRVVRYTVDDVGEAMP